VTAVLADSLCPFVEVDRERVVLEGGIEAYVEPQAVLIDDAGTFIAGLPSYTWDPAAGATTSRDRILALHRAPGADRWVRVANPLADTSGPLAPSRVAGVRAARVGPERWALLIGERTDSAWHESGADRVWYTEIANGVAGPLEPFPIPHGHSLFMLSSPPLSTAGGGLTWAAVATEGWDRPWTTRFYRRTDGVWRVEVVPGVHGGDVAFAWSERTGWTMAAIDSDPEGEDRRTSVVLFRRGDDGWRRLRAIGAVEPGVKLATPYLGHTATGEVLATWWRIGLEGSAILAAVRADLDGEPFVVDASSEQGIPLEGAPSMLWVSHHVGVRDTAQVLRVVRAGPAGRETVGALPHPYTGYFAAELADDDVLHVVGPELDPATNGPVSLLLRMRPRCATPPR
jgi:hypothetical protein